MCDEDNEFICDMECQIDWEEHGDTVRNTIERLNKANGSSVKKEEKEKELEKMDGDFYDSEYDSETENFFSPDVKTWKESLYNNESSEENSKKWSTLFQQVRKIVLNFKVHVCKHSFTLLFLFSLGAVGAFFHFLFPSKTLYGAPIAFWAYFILFLIFAYYLAICLVLIFCFLVIENVYILKKTLFHYVSSLRFPVTFTLCMIIVDVWLNVMYDDEDGGVRKELSPKEKSFQNTLLFLSRATSILLFHGLGLCVSAALVKSFSSHFHRVQCLKKLEETIVAEYALYLLSKTPKRKPKRKQSENEWDWQTNENMALNDLSIQSAESIEYLRSFNLFKSETGESCTSISGDEKDLSKVSNTKMQRMTRFVKNHRISSLVNFKEANQIEDVIGLTTDEKKKQKLKIFSKHLFKNILACSEDPSKKLIVEEDFRNFMKPSLAKKVFNIFFLHSFQSQGPANSGQSSLVGLKPYKTDWGYTGHMEVSEKWTSEKKPEAKSEGNDRQEKTNKAPKKKTPLGVPNEHRHLSKQGLKTAVEEIYRDRVHISRTLADNERLIDKLYLLGKIVTSIATAVFALIQFEYDLEKVILLFSSLFLSYSFVFGSSLNNLMQCSVFLFITRPYIVGDKIYIEKPELILEVSKINLLTTEFFNWDGKQYIYPNHILANSSFVNANNSRPCFEVITIEMSFDTDVRKLGLLRTWILEWVRDPGPEGGARDWRPESAEVLVHTLNHLKKSIRVDVWVESATIWQDFGMRLLRRSRLNLIVKQWLQELKIDYSLPTQKIEFLDSSSVHFKPPSLNLTPTPNESSQQSSQ
eukprot:Nk52_evm18s1737 gene=Nk52_evmTU18s1737